MVGEYATQKIRNTPVSLSETYVSNHATSYLSGLHYTKSHIRKIRNKSNFVTDLLSTLISHTVTMKATSLAHIFFKTFLKEEPKLSTISFYTDVQ